MDAIYDLFAMSKYSTITSISESPITEGLIYVGTDDGLIQVTEDGGLMDAALAMADKMAARSPLAQRLSRIAIDRGMEASFDHIMELEVSHLLVCAGSAGEYVSKRLEQMTNDG